MCNLSYQNTSNKKTTGASLLNITPYYELHGTNLFSGQ